MVTDVNPDAEVPAGAPRDMIGEPERYDSYAVAPDGQRILAIATESNTAAVSATVVLNFAAGLEDRQWKRPAGAPRRTPPNAHGC